MFKIYVPLSGEFLGYCGFKKLWQIIQAILEVLDKIEKKEDLKDLLNSLALYVATLHSWVHFRFPWGISAMYPIKTREDVEEMYRMLTL